jgi:hypothetical protein
MPLPSHARSFIAAIRVRVHRFATALTALAGSLPVPGQELLQLMALGLPGDDTLQHVSQIGLRVEIMEL